jgi:uncharacterized protein (TIGR00297 family)
MFVTRLSQKVYGYTISIAMVAISAPVAYKAKFLDKFGTIAAAALGLAVGISVGPLLLGLLILFLIVNSLFTKLGYIKKALKGAAEPKGGARTWKSVAANGVFAAVFAILEYIYHSDALAVGFMVSIAVASADTTSTEIGLLSRSKPRLITNLSKVAPGTSGGVTALGLLGGVLGATIIGLAGFFVFQYANLRYPISTGYVDAPLRINFDSDPLVYLLAVTLGGFAGAIFDSLLGAVAQAKYVCSVCSNFVEKPVHCGQASKLIAGYRPLDNDTVNIVSIGLGALFGVALFAMGV